jgi:hypothetical protein
MLVRLRPAQAQSWIEHQIVPLSKTMRSRETKTGKKIADVGKFPQISQPGGLFARMLGICSIIEFRGRALLLAKRYAEYPRRRILKLRIFSSLSPNLYAIVGETSCSTSSRADSGRGGRVAGVAPHPNLLPQIQLNQVSSIFHPPCSLKLGEKEQEIAHLQNRCTAHAVSTCTIYASCRASRAV